MIQCSSTARTMLAQGSDICRRTCIMSVILALLQPVAWLGLCMMYIVSNCLLCQSFAPSLIWRLAKELGSSWSNHVRRSWHSTRRLKHCCTSWVRSGSSCTWEHSGGVPPNLHSHTEPSLGWHNSDAPRAEQKCGNLPMNMVWTSRAPTWTLRVAFGFKGGSI